MKLITRMLLMMLVILMGTGMTSCEFFNDNPLSPRLKVRVSEMTVQVGASRKCNVSASTRAKLLYASSDEKIATVDDKGIVTGVSEGDALITVVATNPEGTELFVEESGIIAVKVVAKGSEETEPEKEEVVTASELVAQAQDEGAIVIIWYFLEGNIQHAVFKKVGEDYVLQDENAASARANTRDAEDIRAPAVAVAPYESGLHFGIFRRDDQNPKSTQSVLDAILKGSKVRMQTREPTTYVAAVGVSGNENNTNDNTNPIQKEDVSGSVLVEGATDPEMVDKLNKVDNMLAGEEDYNPDDLALNNVAFVTPDENSDDYKLVSSSEINQSLSNEDSPAAAARKMFDGLKQNIENDVKTGKITFPKISFKEDKKKVKWDPNDASNNTITQTATVDKEGTITYAIYTEDDNTKNTCGATVDANSGKVTFTKPGSATIQASMSYGGINNYAYYTLTVDKAEGSIEFEETVIYKLSTDEPFTNPLKKVGDGEVYYYSSNPDVADIDVMRGTVTINGAGETTIWAEVRDGECYHYETLSVSYKLTVSEPNTIGPGGGYKKGGEI